MISRLVEQQSEHRRGAHLSLWTFEFDQVVDLEFPKVFRNVSSRVGLLYIFSDDHGADRKRGIANLD